jgi:hypothetical protein
MGLRSLAKRFSTPVEELDREKLRSYCTERGQVCAIADLVPREVVVVVGEISSIRVVPHDGSPWLEAVISDGKDVLIVMWTGRRSIPGVTPGRRLVVEGRAMPTRPGSTRLKLMNPAYELLAA